MSCLQFFTVLPVNDLLNTLIVLPLKWSFLLYCKFALHKPVELRKQKILYPLPVNNNQRP